MGCLEFQDLEWEKLSLCGCVCLLEFGFVVENHIVEILEIPQPQWVVESWSWNMEMWGVYWRRKVIVWGAVMIYVLHCGHCVGPTTSMQPTPIHTHTHSNGCDPSFTWWSCFLLTDTHWLSQSFSFSYKVSCCWLTGSYSKNMTGPCSIVCCLMENAPCKAWHINEKSKKKKKNLFKMK